MENQQYYQPLAHALLVPSARSPQPLYSSYAPHSHQQHQQSPTNGTGSSTGAAAPTATATAPAHNHREEEEEEEEDDEEVVEEELDTNDNDAHQSPSDQSSPRQIQARSTGYVYFSSSFRALVCARPSLSTDLDVSQDPTLPVLHLNSPYKGQIVMWLRNASQAVLAVREIVNHARPPCPKLLQTLNTQVSTNIPQLQAAQYRRINSSTNSSGAHSICAQNFTMQRRN